MKYQKIYLTIFGRVKGGWGEWLQWSHHIAQQLNLPISYISSTRIGREGASKATRYSYTRALKTMQLGDIRTVDLYCVPENFKQLAFDWRLLLMRDIQHEMIFFGCEAEHCSLEHLVDLALQLLNHIEPLYGFGEYSDRSAEPVFKSLGISTGHFGSLGNDHEADELRRWRQDLRQERRFEHGLFRSVFNINLLSQLHLNQAIGDSNISDAIRYGILPGNLSPITEDITLWSLQSQEVEPAKLILASNGLLIS